MCLLWNQNIHKTDNVINTWCKKGIYTCTDLSSYVCYSYPWRRIFLSFIFQYCGEGVFCLLFLVLHCPLREIQVTSPEQRHSSHRSSATHSCQCAQYFPVLKQGCDCQCLGFLRVYRCWCMRLHTEAVRTPSESLHWKWTLGEKSLAAPGTRTRVSIVPGLLVRSLYPLSYLRPFSWVVKGKRRQIGIVGPVSKNGTNTQQVAVF